MRVDPAKMKNLSFAVDDNSLLLGFFLLSLILRDPVQEVLTTSRVFDVLHAHVDPLCQDTTSDHTTYPPAMTSLYHQAFSVKTWCDCVKRDTASPHQRDIYINIQQASLNYSCQAIKGTLS